MDQFPLHLCNLHASLHQQPNQNQLASDCAQWTGQTSAQNPRVGAARSQVERLEARFETGVDEGSSLLSLAGLGAEWDAQEQRGATRSLASAAALPSQVDPLQALEPPAEVEPSAFQSSMSAAPCIAVGELFDPGSSDEDRALPSQTGASGMTGRAGVLRDGAGPGLDFAESLFCFDDDDDGACAALPPSRVQSQQLRSWGEDFFEAQLARPVVQPCGPSIGPQLVSTSRRVVDELFSSDEG